MAKLKVSLSIILLFFLFTNAHAGVFSKPIIIGSKYFGKKIGKEVFKGAGEKVIKSNVDELGMKYGTNVINKITKVSLKTNFSKDQISNELLSFGNYYRKSNFAEDAIIFGIKNKKAGKHLLDKFDYSDLKSSGLLNSNNKEVVTALWRISDDLAIGGSKSKLKRALKKSNISVDNCIPCKKLLDEQDRYTKISFKKIPREQKAKQYWRPQPYNEDDIVFDATWGNPNWLGHKYSNKSFSKARVTTDIRAPDILKKTNSNSTTRNILKQEKGLQHDVQSNNLNNYKTIQHKGIQKELNKPQANKKTISDKKSKKIEPNERKIINSEYAGKKYPIDKLPAAIQKKYPRSVDFDKHGYPDFSPYAKKEVKVKGLNGNYANDFTLANKSAGFDRTPDGYTWHHHQDGKTMLLVPSDLHGAIRHTGGASKLKTQS